MDMDFSMFANMAAERRSEDNVCARFYDRSVKTGQIDEHGFPVFANVCFCEIRIKDNNTEVFDQPADAEKIRRFPNEYARYRQAKKQLPEGTPLEQFAFLNLAEVDALKSRGIFTVETLAALAPQKAADLGISREHDLAVRFVERAQNNKSLQAWQLAEEKYLAQIKNLEAEVNNLRAQLRKGYRR